MLDSLRGPIRNRAEIVRLRRQGLSLAWSVRLEGDAAHLRHGSGCHISAGSLVVVNEKGPLVLGDRVWFGEYSNVRAGGGSITIGSHVLFAQFVSVIAENHTVDENGVPNWAETDKVRSGVTIGDHCWLGVGSIILPGVDLGESLHCRCRRSGDQELPSRVAARRLARACDLTSDASRSSATPRLDGSAPGRPSESASPQHAADDAGDSIIWRSGSPGLADGTVLGMSQLATRVAARVRSIVSTDSANPNSGCPTVPSDMGEAFGVAHDRAWEFTMTGQERMFALWQSAQHVCRARIPGDIVECGVWRGGSAMLAMLAMSDVGHQRPVWLYDTFEGMPPPSEKDHELNGVSALERLATQKREAAACNAWAYATLDDVRRQMASTGYPAELIHFVAGKVEQTIPQHVPESIALLRLDTDWYESTLHELEHLWPRLSVGGVLIVDDYGHWQGARAAVDEYFAAQGIPLLLHRVDYTARIAVKS